PQQVGGIPINGTRKFTIYLTGGNADPSHPIPIIRNEELILLRAEAKLGQGNTGGAIADIDIVRTNAGKLAPYSGSTAPDAVLAELLYNRRYSLLWEQGTTWNDARRFGRIVDGYIVGIGEVPGFGADGVPRSQVGLRFPIPDTECSARGQTSGCSPLGT
ncbi:MAG TPA: RagB/SusD family nutrient uptake outer membrane protein, partial [Gemmatimonadales bacterium]|nr:RagB/SusD family nutrient uptake outer membrane protein [Gemmatimonadales bacterium]